jgi:AcrR family transcriptional regulator
VSDPALKAPSETAQVVLSKAIPLFAKSGYEGVSMRDIAGAVGISGAALYHHYPNKQSLYLASMALAFEDKAIGITTALEASGTAIQRLERFVAGFTDLIAKDPDFRALLQRELLDGDEIRLKLLADQVFMVPFQAMTALAKELAPDCDPHLLAISMVGLVLFHFEATPVRRFLPGTRATHNDPKLIARHVTRLLTKGLGSA